MQLVVAPAAHGARRLELVVGEGRQPAVDTAAQDIYVGHTLGHQNLPRFRRRCLVVAHHHDHGARRFRCHQQIWRQPFHFAQRNVARVQNVEEIVIGLATHIQHHHLRLRIVDQVQQFARVDLDFSLGQAHRLRLFDGRPALARGRLTDEQHHDRAHEEGGCRAVTPARRFTCVLISEILFQLFATPEHEEGHQHQAHDDDARIYPEQLRQGETTQVGRVPEILVKADRLAKKEDAEENAQGEEDTVYLCRSDRNQRGARTEAADNEAKAHYQAADNPGPQVGRIDPDQVVIQQSNGGGSEDQNHGHHNSAEHHLEYR